MFFFNQIGKSIKCPRWILVKNEIQNRKIANLMNFSHANGEVRVLKTPRNHHKSKDHNFLHRSYTPKKFPAQKNLFFSESKKCFSKIFEKISKIDHIFSTKNQIFQISEHFYFFKNQNLSENNLDVTK